MNNTRFQKNNMYNNRKYFRHSKSFIINKIVLCLFCTIFVFPSIGLSGDMQWNWDREGHTTDGSMTFKDESNNPFETNVNPTGENVKINKSTAREAPVVYVQSGGSSGSQLCTAPPTRGDFGGDSYCETYCGSSYKVATEGELSQLKLSPVVHSGSTYESKHFWINAYTDVNNNDVENKINYRYILNCKDWSDVHGNVYGGNFYTRYNETFINGISYIQWESCSRYLSVLCVKK